jgi:hypothetical protein
MYNTKIRFPFGLGDCNHVKIADVIIHCQFISATGKDRFAYSTQKTR